MQLITESVDMECDECNKKQVKLVVLGELPDYDYCVNRAYICEECLIKALELINATE